MGKIDFDIATSVCCYARASACSYLVVNAATEFLGFMAIYYRVSLLESMTKVLALRGYKSALSNIFTRDHSIPN